MVISGVEKDIVVSTFEGIIAAKFGYILMNNPVSRLFKDIDKQLFQFTSKLYG